MPTVFHCQGYRFYFYSNEGHPREPTHVHVHVHVRGNVTWRALTELVPMPTSSARCFILLPPTDDAVAVAKAVT